MDLETPSFILFEHTMLLFFVCYIYFGVFVVQLQKLYFPSLVFLSIIGVFATGI